MSKYLVGLGLLLVVIGLLWPWLAKLPLGKLPGDIMIKGENYSFYFPLATSLVVSFVLSLLLWILRK